MKSEKTCGVCASEREREREREREARRVREGVHSVLKDMISPVLVVVIYKLYTTYKMCSIRATVAPSGP